MEPRGIRNNNPGNIRATNIPWQGKTGNDGEYEIFESPHYGIRALAKTLQTYLYKHGLETVREIINRWAPPTENPTNRYVEFVSKKLNVDPDKPLPLRQYIIPLTIAIIEFENGYNPYSMQTIAKAVKAAGWDITSIE